jgi:hypothetical protein
MSHSVGRICLFGPSLHLGCRGEPVHAVGPGRPIGPTLTPRWWRGQRDAGWAHPPRGLSASQQAPDSTQQRRLVAPCPARFPLRR